MYNRVGQQGKGTNRNDRTTQRLYNKQTLTSTVIYATHTNSKYSQKNQ